MPHQIRIREFPKANDLWRIDWFGEVSFPNRLLLQRHPSVVVYLSKINGDTSLFSRQGTAKAEQQLQCRVSVGKLMLLRIGDIWKDQQLFDTPGYEQETFHDLSINRETTVLIKAGLSVEDGGFLLPLSEHPGHRRSTQSYCLRVMMPDGRSLVIPCMELIRFYFGSTSDLLNLLFRPGLSRDHLYTSRVFNPKTGYMRIALSELVHPRSAADVGRIAGDPVAWHAANLGLTSLVRSTASGTDRNPFPQGIFPFEGQTDLTVSGKWLSLSGLDRQTFVVYQIRSCSHSFPFTTLHYTGGAAKRKQQQPTPDEGQGIDGTGGKAAAPAESHLVEQDPNKDLARAVRAVDARRRFPDLDRKPVFGSKDLTRNKAGRPGRHHEPVQEEAAGEPASSDRIRAVSLVDAVSKAGDPPVWLAEAYGILRETAGIQAELLTCSDTDGWSVPLPICVDDDGVIDERLLVAEGQFGRLRRTCAFRILAGDRSTVLVVIEAPELTTMAYSDSRDNEVQLLDALERAVMEFHDSFGTAAPVKALPLQIEMAVRGEDQRGFLSARAASAS